MAAKPPAHTSARDLSVWVNNALLGWRKSFYFMHLQDKQGQKALDARMAKLRVYMEAHLAPLTEAMGEKLLDPSEAIYVLLAETAMVMGTALPGASKFPAYQDLSARILEDTNKAEEKPDGE
jgi:hypothetical protein